MGTVSPIPRIHRTGMKGWIKGIVPLTITPNNPLENFLLPIPMTLSSADLEVLVPQSGVLLPRDLTNSPLNQNFRLPCGQFGLLMPLN